MLNFHPDNIFDQFSESIPHAHERAEDYLRAIAHYAGQAQLPVAADVQEGKPARGFRAPTELFLVLTPTERRLRRYPSCHFGRPLGMSLSVGWYLLGQQDAAGLGGWAIAGGASQADVDDLSALIHVVHDMAVIPAMHEVAGAGDGRAAEGFFGA